jgi:twinkle protein
MINYTSTATSFEDVKTKKNVVEYSTPDVTLTELSLQALQVMKARGIEKETLDFWRVKECVLNNRNYYTFQCFDEKDKLNHNSYRATTKKPKKGAPDFDFYFRQSPGTKSILWGMWHIDVTKPLVITEGQPDAMIIWQSGYKNVVSVPGGSAGEKWIEHSWYWLQQIPEFILFGDNDPAGYKMLNELKIRLGSEKTNIVKHEYKDATEVWYYQGAETIIKCINDTLNRIPDGIIMNAELKKANTTVEAWSTGIDGLDKAIRGLQPKLLTLLCGITSHGKSTILSQMICSLIDEQVPTLIYSGELPVEAVTDWVYLKAVGKERRHIISTESRFGTDHRVNDNALSALNQWSSKLLYTIDNHYFKSKMTMDLIFDTFELAVKKLGCRVIIADNLMSCMNSMGDNTNLNEFQRQEIFAQRCKDFAERFNVHFILVIHPNKQAIPGTKMTFNNINGRIGISAIADIIVCVEKFIEPDRVSDGRIYLIKNRFHRKLTEHNLDFDELSGSLTEVGHDIKKYKWLDYVKKDWTYEVDQVAIDDIEDDEMPF